MSARLTKLLAEAAGEQVDRIAELEADLTAIRSHVSRLEESLRVALEARAEAVEVLRRCQVSMSHAVTFIQSREKMHVAGVALFLEAKEAAERAIGKGE